MNTLAKINKHWLDSFFGDTYYTPQAYEPRTDISETENGYSVSMDLPGFTDSEVTVEFKDNKLTVSANHAESNEENADGETRVLRRERRERSYHRVFVLPAHVDSENIQASLKNGVLELDIPKREEAKPRQITIK
jgi:HSP20 family protein